MRPGNCTRSNPHPGILWWRTGYYWPRTPTFNLPRWKNYFFQKLLFTLADRKSSKKKLAPTSKFKKRSLNIWPPLFKSWIALPNEWISLHWTALLVSLKLIRWIVIYRVDIWTTGTWCLGSCWRTCTRNRRLSSGLSVYESLRVLQISSEKWSTLTWK